MTLKQADPASGRRATRLGIDWRQERILAERYLDIVINDWGNTFLLLMQAPVIALLVILRWRDAPLTPSLYFVLAIAAVWFGCINACRELVKERGIYRRERLVNLDAGAYLVSKLQILAMLDFLQCLALLGLVHRYVHLRGNIALLFIVLFCTSLAGTTLGLLLSALASSTDKAVGLAPLVTIPQILFSKFVLSEEYLKGLPVVLEKLTIVRWSWEGFEELTKAVPAYGLVLRDVLVLTGMGLAFSALTYLAMRATEGRE